MIEQFQPLHIERFLRENNLRYLVDQDGNFILDFDGDGNPDYRIQLSAEGETREILCIRSGTEVLYPEAIRDRIEGFVAGWNRKMRWPKAVVAEDRRGRGLCVIGENSFPLAPGIHQGLVDDFVAISISAGQRMLGELAAAVNTPPADELETWLRQAG